MMVRMEDRAVEMRRAVVRKDFPLLVEVRKTFPLPVEVRKNLTTRQVSHSRPPYKFRVLVYMVNCANIVQCQNLLTSRHF